MADQSHPKTEPSHDERLILSGTSCLSLYASCVGCRGSTGFGEDSIQSLPGHISVNDVEDCIAALDHAVAEGNTLPCPPLQCSHHLLVLEEGERRLLSRQMVLLKRHRA